MPEQVTTDDMKLIIGNLYVVQISLRSRISVLEKRVQELTPKPQEVKKQA